MKHALPILTVCLSLGLNHDAWADEQTLESPAATASLSSNNLDIEGKAVYSGEDIVGYVDSVVESLSARKMVIINLEDQLKDVAWPLDRLSSENGKLIVDIPKWQLSARPDAADSDRREFTELEPGEYERAEFSRFEEKVDQ